jgi:hypothetical protein
MPPKIPPWTVVPHVWQWTVVSEAEGRMIRASRRAGQRININVHRSLLRSGLVF